MMMMMKSVFWWRKPEYPEETTDLRQVTDSGACETSITHEECNLKVKQNAANLIMNHRGTYFPS